MYNEIATLYHLIYRDWNAVIAQQAAALDAIMREHVGPSPRSILDVSCGIGTQALGLAALGHAVTASDLSAAAVGRARLDAPQRNLSPDFPDADMRRCAEVRWPRVSGRVNPANSHSRICNVVSSVGRSVTI